MGVGYGGKKIWQSLFISYKYKNNYMSFVVTPFESRFTVVYMPAVMLKPSLLLILAPLTFPSEG